MSARKPGIVSCPRRLLVHARAISLVLAAVFAGGRVLAQDDGSADADRKALIALYNATDGGNWRFSDNWLSDAPLSDWYGVRVDGEGRVTELALLENNLKGPLPDEIGNLKKLTRLSLIFNNLSGEIPPAMAGLTNLRSLDLQWNTLSGEIPPELGDMANLQSIILATNQLTGNIPEEFANLPGLYNLALSNNDLTGTIPSALGDSPALQLLSLEANGLSGTIPASLANADLSYLDLDFNIDLGGPLPPGMTSLSSMNTLSIHGTSVCVPTDTDYRRWLDGLPHFDTSGIDCGVEPDPTPVIDVAVFYTPAARRAAGGTDDVEAAIDLMVTETNQAYVDSGVRQRIALTAVEEIRYREADSSFVDLFRLTVPSDGHLDGVHAVRDLTGADLVHLIVAKGSACGIAWPVPRADGAFGITLLSCGGLTFAHEIGHGMGLMHDRYVECPRWPTCTGSRHYPYSFGYVNPRGLDSDASPSSRWITIMAYHDRCRDAGASCMPLPRFSNPQQSRNGHRLGQPGDRDSASVDGPADAVRALNNTRHSVAAFREGVRFLEGDSPMARGTLPDAILTLGEPPLVLEVSGAFRDPNGDLLTFSASSSGKDAGEHPVASAVVSGSKVTVEPLAPGLTVITVTATDTGGSNTSAWQQFNVTVEKQGTVDYDGDGDRLIEIRTLAQLDAMRHDLNGDGVPDNRARYEAAFPDGGLSMGCEGFCGGYELAANLDFDTNGNGRADAGDDYWNGGRGWLPIEGPVRPFDAVFEGNGYAIANLFIDRGEKAALFGRIGRDAAVRRLALIDVNVTGDDAAGLVGTNLGVVHASHVSGRVAGRYAGGLVIANWSHVSASYSTAEIASSEGGGLVAWNLPWGQVIATYATGDIIGSGGGLIGLNEGTVAGSYAAGSISGSGGGLVRRGDGRVLYSYWDTDTSGHTTSAGGIGRTTAQLRTPTRYGGIYARWNVDVDGDGRPDDPWDFGNSTEYPVLSLDFDADGQATWEEFGDQRGPIPRLAVATLVEQWLTLVFSKDLDQSSRPSPRDFTVRVDGTETPVEAVEVDGREVRLRLRKAPEDVEEVTVSYTPGANPIRGVAGNPAPAIDRSPVKVDAEPLRSFWRAWRLILLREEGE